MNQNDQFVQYDQWGNPVRRAVPGQMPVWWPSNNAQPRQQPAQPQAIPIQGKFIGSLQDIAPNDVPMDNSVGYFPLSDYSAIYAKKWEANGTITTVKYVPEILNQEPEKDPNQEFQQSVQNRLLAMQNTLNVMLDAWQIDPEKIAKENTPKTEKEKSDK